MAKSIVPRPARIPATATQWLQEHKTKWAAGPASARAVPAAVADNYAAAGHAQPRTKARPTTCPGHHNIF